MQKLTFALLLLSLTGPGIAPSAFAAAPLTFVRDIPLPSGPFVDPIGIVSFPSGSVVGGSSYPAQRFLVTTTNLYILPSRGSSNPSTLYRTFVTTEPKFDLNSRVSGYISPDDGHRELVMSALPRNITRFNIEDGSFISSVPSAPLLLPPGAPSLQVSPNGAGFVLRDNQLSTLDIKTGSSGLLTPVAANVTAMSIGKDGLLYVLDPFVGRVLGFSQAGIYQRQFPLAAGLIVDQEQQFAAAPDGRFYVGNGIGGGAVYSPSGAFLGSFVTPGIPGSPLPLNKGNHIISVDPDGTLLMADRTSDTIHEFVPTPIIENLIADVKALNLAKGQENSLLAKLDAAQKSLDKGNDKAAQSQLNAFVNEVLAQFKSGRIAEAVATKLITEAQGVINSIPG